MKIFSNKRGRSKKGDFIGDGLLLLLALPIIAMIIIVVKGPLNDINTDIQASDMPNVSKQISAQSESRYGPVWDAAIVFAIFGMILGIAILSFFLDSHPVFIIIALIVIPTLLFLAALVSNVFFDTIESDTTFESIASTDFSMTKALLDNWLLLAIGALTMIGIALYAKTRLQ